MKRFAIIAMLLLITTIASAAPTPPPGPGNGFEDYLCRIWHGFEICRVKPGNGPK